MPDLLEAYRRLDPAKPIDTGMGSFYVARPDDPVGILSAELTADSRRVRALLGGQRGVGKTSELFRLAGDLRRAGSPVFLFDIGSVLPAYDADLILRELAR